MFDPVRAREELVASHEAALADVDKQVQVWARHVPAALRKLDINIKPNSYYSAGCSKMTEIEIKGDKKTHLPISVVGLILKHMPPASKHPVDIKGAASHYATLPISFNLKPEERMEICNDPYIKIQYKVAEKVSVSLRMSVKKLQEHKIVIGANRKITSSEYHYYSGMSQKDLLTETISTLVFSLTTNRVDVIKFYGGDSVIIGEDKHDRLRDLILSVACAEGEELLPEATIKRKEKGK